MKRRGDSAPVPELYSRLVSTYQKKSRRTVTINGSEMTWERPTVGIGYFDPGNAAPYERYGYGSPLPTISMMAGRGALGIHVGEERDNSLFIWLQGYHLRAYHDPFNQHLQRNGILLTEQSVQWAHPQKNALYRGIESSIEKVTEVTYDFFKTRLQGF